MIIACFYSFLRMQIQVKSNQLKNPASSILSKTEKRILVHLTIIISLSNIELHKRIIIINHIIAYHKLSNGTV